MFIDRAGWPFVALATVPAGFAFLAARPTAGAWLLLLPVGIALFFRDPERQAPAGADLILAPADGKVIFAGVGRAGQIPPGAWQQITIFLSPLDVHINRTPVSGRVARVDYRSGTFLPAYRADAHQNEQSEIWFEHDGQPVVARQVVGMLARRVVCRLSAGDTVEAGMRFGLMKFGSRMDVFVPMTATLRVSAGQRVRGGETVIAQLASGGH
jgi:phosphatidylserine decarboxylase